MSKNVDWIKTLLIETRKHHSSVTEAVLSRTEELLKAQLSERQVPATELKIVASALIADMVPKARDTEAKE